MAYYAVLNGGAVVMERDIPDWGSYPAHKKEARDERGDGHAVLRPLEGSTTAPDHDPLTHDARMSYAIAPEMVTRAWTLVAKDLQLVKAEAVARLDKAAETTRLRYITDGTGQALSYDRKRREALQAIDDLAPTAQKYPVLFASIGIEVSDTGNAKTDCDAIAMLVIGRETAWAQVAAQIEAVRLAAKKAITNATTVEQVQAAAQVTWP